MRKIFTTLCCVMALATIKLNAQCITTFGNYLSSFSIAANFSPNYLLGDSYTLTTGGTLTGLAYKGNGTGGTMRMAIYANGSGVPSNLVAYTNTVLVGTGNIIIPVTTPTAIPAGVYWIMADYVNGSGTNHVNYTTSTTKTVAYISYSPLSIPPTTASWSTYTGQDFDYWGVISANGPTVAISGNTTVCNGQSLNLTASGANTYTWSTSAQTTTISITPSVTTNYTVVGTNTAGCIGSTVTTIVVNATPTISVNSGAICAGSSFTMVPSGANSYTFSNGSAVATPSANSSYTVTGTNTVGCVSNAVISSVTVNATPTISVNSGAICAGSSFTIVPSGASSYTFQGGGAVKNPTATTSYTVAGTNTAGCISNIATSNVTVNALPTVTATSNSSSLCVGQTANLTASGATTYSWNTGATSAVLAVTPSVTTTYTVSGVAVNGCSNIATVTQNVIICMGIQTNNSNQLAISVYPNPSNGNFTVELANGLTKVINVTDITGRVVLTTTSSEDKVTVNISNLSNGIYYIKVASDNKAEVTKVIKQ